MNIRISPSTKIFVAVAANAATGGPELLHQLVYSLRVMHIDAYMFYVPADHPQPIHQAYQTYSNPFVRKIEDTETNIIIAPEIYGIIKGFDQLKKIQKVIWWLSVDNFFVSRSLEKFPDQILINSIKILNKVIGYPKFDIHKLVMRANKNFNRRQDKYLASTEVHFVQSFYAKETLLKIGIPQNQIHYLSDYLNEDFLNTGVKQGEKEDIIVYNPAKGYQFTREIIKQMPDYKFIPITKMNRLQVKKLLLKAKVYIDFGNHPGKDRMPREAAILGCCVITGLRGSANNDFDISIQNDYKFEDRKSSIPEIVDAIKRCIENYNTQIINFKNYRIEILSGKDKFLSDLNEMLNKSRIK